MKDAIEDLRTRLNMAHQLTEGLELYKRILGDKFEGRYQETAKEIRKYMDKTGETSPIKFIIEPAKRMQADGHDPSWYIVVASEMCNREALNGPH